MPESFEEIDYDRLFNVNERKPKRYYMNAIYYLSSRSTKQLRTWHPNKKGSGSYKETPVCDRFLLFGIPNKRHALICFTQSATDTKIAPRFSDHISPGDTVSTVNPAVKSLRKDNIIFSLTDPLILREAKSYLLEPQILPANDLDKAQYSTFDFVTNSLQLIGAVLLDSVSSDTFCDSQSVKKNCACIV